MQSVNQVQFLMIKCFLLFGFAAVPVFGNGIVPLKSIYPPHKLDFKLEIKFNLTLGIILSMHVIIYFNPIFCSKSSWLTSCLTSLLFFDISLLYYYIKYQTINSFLSFYWRCISFFRYFFIIFICTCF